MNIHLGIKEVCRSEILELPRHAQNECHFVIPNSTDLLNLCHWAADNGYDFCSAIAVDERLRVKRAFKIFYILSYSDTDELAILEHQLSDIKPPLYYQTISSAFPSVKPFEREFSELFGFQKNSPENDDLHQDFLLHKRAYSQNLHPLWRTLNLEEMRGILAKRSSQDKIVGTNHLPEGMFIVPVGPIHAGIIEPGFFPFHVAGEVIEKLPLQLGYKHRGIEKLFETHYFLDDGWKLAEKVSGDSSFAHSLSYCQAVESIVGVTPPLPALYWRGLLLELERLYNHISDVGLLAVGLAYEKIASAIGTLRETLVQLNSGLTGHRLLRGVNHPGGVVFPTMVDLHSIRFIIDAVVDKFLGLSKQLLENPECRDRMLETGLLTKDEAKLAVGLVKRASGWIKHDFRIQHPQGAYADQRIQDIIQSTIVKSEEDFPKDRVIPIYESDLQGDVLARMAIRVAEVEISSRIIKQFSDQLISLDPALPTYTSIDDELKKVGSLEFGLGYVEGFRGPIIYFLVGGPSKTIFRCKVVDPSFINWHVFPDAVVRKKNVNQQDQFYENILADFPLINKSFNLSYAGHDL